MNMRALSITKGFNCIKKSGFDDYSEFRQSWGNTSDDKHMEAIYTNHNRDAPMLRSRLRGKTMKRTAAAFVLVAGLGGCVSPDSGKKHAMADQPRSAISAKMNTDSKVVQAEGRSSASSQPRNGPRSAMKVEPGSMYDPAIRQAAGMARVTGPGCAPEAGFPQGSMSGYGGEGDAYGPRQGYFRTALGGGGILPAPGMGPPGVVAGQGFIGPGGPGMGGMFNNQRTSIRFVSPAGMKIAFQDPTQGFTDAGREAPVRYNFPQGAIYRLRLSGILSQPGKNFYPTLEVYPSTLKTITFLSHSTVPIGFTDEDLEQVKAGNLVVKVIYLPDPAFQDLAAAEEIVSTRLEPGIDPITEANRRGTILAVIRIGNIDLEDPSTPAMDAPPGSGMIPPPGMLPGGMGQPPETTPLPSTPVPAPRPVPSSLPPFTPAPMSTRPALPLPTAPGSTSNSRVPNTLPSLNVPGVN